MHKIYSLTIDFDQSSRRVRLESSTNPLVEWDLTLFWNTRYTDKMRCATNCTITRIYPQNAARNKLYYYTDIPTECAAQQTVLLHGYTHRMRCATNCTITLIYPQNATRNKLYYYTDILTECAAQQTVLLHGYTHRMRCAANCTTLL